LQEEFKLTYLFISHGLAVVEHISDRVAVMYLGRIVEVAPTGQIFSTPRHPYTRGLLDAIPRMTEGADDGRKPAIAGDPPSPLRLPSGCRFRTRCPMAQPRCEQEDPALSASPDDTGHLAACHFAFGAVAAAVGELQKKEQP
jgi:oligopeptide/dipeptide ABC transporter ATP-binding protein